MKSGTAQCMREWAEWMKNGQPKLKNIKIKKDESERINNQD